ncbi:MAG: HupE/UreJ family protein [Myxococcota bacterium]
MRATPYGLLVGALAVCVLLASAAHAHPLAPALLELRERGDGQVEVRFKTPVSRLPGVELAPALPAECVPLAPPTLAREGTGVVERFVASCGDAALVGARVGVRGLEASPTDALLRVDLADGRRVQAVLRGSRPFHVIPSRPSRLAVMGDYALLGLEHIASGLDHLLFVLGLLLLAAGRVGPVVKTVTAFTVGHSVTLSLAVLGFVRFPIGLIELAIAASVFVLGAELARGPGAPPSRLRRFPWLMAGAFGLLHGFGFAGALAQVGLPGGEIPLSLFAFNLGIELGQLAFIGLVLAGWRVLLLLRAPAAPWLRAAPAYGIGTLAAYWCLERAASLVQ